MILGVAGAPLAVLLIMGNLVSQTMSQIGDVVQVFPVAREKLYHSSAIRQVI